MKATLPLIVALLSTSVYAYNDDPKEMFYANNKHETIQLTWKPVDNVQSACEQMYVDRGVRLTWKVQACSFWDGNLCTIITSKKTNMHSIGHEVRHCFQGNYH